MSTVWMVDLAVAGEGPYMVRRIPAQRPHPMFKGDTGSPEMWSVDGPGEMAQLFRNKQVAVAICAALNAIHRINPSAHA